MSHSIATPEYVAIAGPTASGKTAAALALAARRPCEIVSVDSALVYRSMDIGTAKPTKDELAKVPHHLIDIRDPLQSYSAADFARDARQLIADIRGRGALPLLVGGTMLYFKALFEGMDDMPASDPAIRAALDTQVAAQGWPALHAELAQVDPVTAARLSPNDSQRIQRALEVFRMTGQPLSAFHRRAHADRAEKTNSDYLLVSLEPADRAWLHARIAQRFDAMLATGLIEEVQALRQRGDLNPDLASMRCVGYRQTWEALDGLWPQAELRDRGIAATRQLAKRQITWLRSMPQRQVVHCDATDAMDSCLQLIESRLPKNA